MNRCAPSTRVRIPRSKRSIKQRYLANKKTSKKGNKRNTTRRHNRKIRVQTLLHDARNTSKGIGGQGSLFEGGIRDWNYNTRQNCNICGRTFCLTLRVHQCRLCAKKVCYYCASESTGNYFKGFRQLVCICCNIPSFMGELFKFKGWFQTEPEKRIKTKKANFNAQHSSQVGGTVKQSTIILNAFYLDAVVRKKITEVYNKVYMCPYVILCPYRETELRDKHYNTKRRQFHTDLNVFLHTFKQLTNRTVGVAFLGLNSSKTQGHLICIIVNKQTKELYLFDPNGTWRSYSPSNANCPQAQQSAATSSTTNRFVTGERVRVKSTNEYGRVVQRLVDQNEKYIIQLDSGNKTEFDSTDLDGQHTMYSYFTKNREVINENTGLNITSVKHSHAVLQEGDASCGLWTILVAVFSLTGVPFDDIFTYRLYESNMIPIVQQYYDALATLKMDNGTGQSLEAFLNSGKLTEITSPPYLQVEELRCTQEINVEALLPPQIKVKNLHSDCLTEPQKKRLIYILCWHPHFTVKMTDDQHIEFIINDWQQSNDVARKFSELEIDLSAPSDVLTVTRENSHSRKYTTFDVLSYPYPPCILTLAEKFTIDQRSIHIAPIRPKDTVNTVEYSLFFSHFLSADCETLKQAKGRLQKGMALTQIDDTSLRKKSYKDVITHLKTIPFQTMQWEWLQ